MIQLTRMASSQAQLEEEHIAERIAWEASLEETQLANEQWVAYADAIAAEKDELEEQLVLVKGEMETMQVSLLILDCGMSCVIVHCARLCDATLCAELYDATLCVQAACHTVMPHNVCCGCT